MRRQGTWISLALLTALAMGVISHRVLKEPLALRAVSTSVERSVVTTPSLSAFLAATANASHSDLADDDPGTQQVFFDSIPLGGPVHADAVDVPVPQLPRLLESAGDDPPSELPRPAAAQPIDGQTAIAERELNELIERELQDSSAPQQQVWREVLQGLPAKEAEEILQIWKLTGRPLPSAGDAAWPIRPPPHESETSPPPREELAAEVVRENLQHVDTPGYRRRELLPSHRETTASDSAEAPFTRLDLTPGATRRTGNPLHVAIEGEGFFVLRRGETVAWTRNGEFDLNEQRQLVQRRADGDWSLESPIQIPEAAVRILIAADGQVAAITAAQPELPIACGQIELATCLNPQHLSPFAGDLLATNVHTGATHRAPPGSPLVGRLVQGALELSNTTHAAETAALEIIEQTRQLVHRAAACIND